MNALMTIQVRVLSASALARLRAVEMQSKKTADGVGMVGKKAQWGLPWLSKWGNQVQWAGRQLMYNFTLPIALAMGAATKFALENEKAMTRVIKVYGDGSKRARQLAKVEIPALGKALEALSNKFGIAQADAINIAGDWAAAGASGLALAKSVELTMETMVLGELSAVDATKQLIAIQAQYGFNTKQLAETIEILNMVENQTGASMADLMQGMSRAAGVARVAGVDVEHLSAMMAALTPSAGSAATAGNALKTIISRILSPTEDAVALLQEMGVAVDSTAWTSQNATSRIEYLAKSFEGLSDAQKVHMSTVLGSRWQLNRLVVLMQAVRNENSYYNKSLDATSDKQKLFNQYQFELNKVLTSNPQRVKQAWVIIQNAMARVIVPLLPFITYLASEVARLATAFANLGGDVQKLILVGLVFLALLGPIARYVGAVANMFGLLSAFTHFMGKAFMFLAGGVIKATLIPAFAAVQKAAMFFYTKLVFGFYWAFFRIQKMIVVFGATLKLLPASLAIAGRSMLLVWTITFTQMRNVTILFMAGMRTLWLGFSLGMLTLQKTLVMSLVMIWRVFFTRLPLMMLTMVKQLAAVGRLILVALSSPWTLAIAAALGLAYHFRDELVRAWNSIATATTGIWGAIAGFFRDMIQHIIDMFWMLPESVTNAMIAVLTVIRDAALQIYEWMSYLNPFARHSPSLVESVTAGMDEIQHQYGRIANIGGIFAKAASDLAKFKKIAGQGRGEFADDRANVVKAKGNVGLFDAMQNDIKRLQPVLARQEAAVNRQEGVVARWKKRLDAANVALEKQQDKLDRLQGKLDAVTAEYQKHQERLEYFANAPLKGMGAMEDQIFANEMAQKKLRLEILRMGDAGDSIDNTKSRLEALFGEIESLRGQAADLRAAGAGSDILGPIDQQISAMEAQANAMRGAVTSSPVAELQKQLEELQRQGEVLDLEKSLKFDPLTREIQKLVDTSEELSFDRIVKGIKYQQAAMDELQPKMERLTEAVADQQGVVDRLTDARDRVSDRYDKENNQLQQLQDSYQKTEEVIRDLESALRDMGQASADALQKAKEAADKAKDAKKKSGADGPEVSNAVRTFRAGAGGNWPDVGGKSKIGREGGWGPQDIDLEQFAQEKIDEMNQIFGGFDMFKPLRKWWDRTWNNIKESVGPHVQGVADAIGNALSSLPNLFGDAKNSGFGKGVQKAWDTVVDIVRTAVKIVGHIIDLFAPDVRRIWDSIVEAGKRIWTKIGPELEKFGALWEPLVEVLSNFWNVIKIAAYTLGAIFLPVIKIITGIISETFGPILNMVIDVLAGIIKAVRGLFEIVLGIFTADGELLKQGIVDLFGGLIDAIAGLISGAWHIITGIFWGIVNGIKEAWAWLKDILVGHSIIPDMIDMIFAAFDPLVKLATWVWDNVLKPVKDFFVKLYNDVMDKLDDWWGDIKQAWNALIGLAGWVWDNVLKPVFQWFKDLWDLKVKPELNQWWENIKLAWAVLGALGQWVWDNVLKPVFQWFKDLWDLKVKPELAGWWDRLVKVWDNLKGLAGWFWDNVLAPIKDKFTDAFNKIKEWFQDNKDTILSPIKSVVKGIVDAINWVIKGINKLSELPGLDFSIPLIEVQYAAGGPLMARAANRGFKTNGARAIVGEGKANYPEYVIPTDPTHRNRARALYQAAGTRIGMAGVPLHADGGILGSIGDAFGKAKDWGAGALDWAGDKAKNAASFLFSPFKNMANNLIDKIDWKYGRMAAQSAFNEVFSWISSADKVFADKMENVGVAPGGKFPITGGDWEKIIWRGFQFNVRTVKMIQAAEKLLGQMFHITQGSYSTSVAASGNTHAGGGVFDATSPVTTTANTALRKVGFASWIRSPSQGPWPYHIHAVALGDITASAAAKSQMASFLAGGDGLAMGGVVLRSNGGTVHRLGEGGNDEAVIPLPRNWRQDAFQSNSSDARTININGNLSFPNITRPEDAEEFLKNLETVARD